MIGVRVFLYIMYYVSVVLNTSLLAARFCNIKKSKRERRRDCCVSFCLVWIMRKKPRVQSITLAPHNSRVTATLISHAAELKIDLTAWQSIMRQNFPLMEWMTRQKLLRSITTSTAPRRTTHPTPSTTMDGTYLYISSSFHQPVHFSWTTLQAIFWAISSAAAWCFWWKRYDGGFRKWNIYT